jgi:predicted nuclease with TOPRIM domain
MEAEFVNIFVEKQKQYIIDLTLRNLMLDARVAYMEQAAKRMVEEFQQQKEAVETQQQEMSQTLTLKEGEIEHLRKRVQELLEELQKTQMPAAKK